MSRIQAHAAVGSRAWLAPVLIILSIAIAGALSVEGLGAILPPPLWWRAFISPDARDIRQIIVHDSWLPRLVMSWLCGATLGLAGTVFQQVLRNPLAEPMTLVVSAGAQLALTASALWAPSLLGHGEQWIALAGALASAAIVFSLSWRSGLTPATVAVAGLVVTLYCGSIGVALQLFHAPYLRGLFIWGGGSLIQQDWSRVAMLAPRLIMGSILAFLLLRPMTLFGLDDANVRGLGLSLRRTRLAALLLAVVLGAAVAGAVGVIGFVGLASPALARLAGARRLSQRLWAAPLCGALVLWLTDQAVQRLSGAFGDLIPTGAATALFGAPLMLVLLTRLHRPERLPSSDVTHERIVPDVSLNRRFLAVLLVLAVALPISLDLGRGVHGLQFLSFDAWTRVAVWRMPRAVAALAAGAMLSVAGTLMQRLTGNPLASPEVLGVSAGAALGLIAIIVVAGDASHLARIAATALGAFAALCAILWFGRHSRFAPDRVLLAGIAIGALFQAVVAVAIAGGGERAAALLAWFAGSTYTITPADAVLAVALCAVLCALTPLCGRWLTILPLGEANARALGLPTRHARFALLCLIAMHTAVATLIVGPLSFIGLTAPHFARLLGARKPLDQVMLAAPIGALTMICADWLGRALLMPRELPAGLMATLIGAPYLMWLLGRRR